MNTQVATLLSETELIAAMAPLIADLAESGRGAVALAGSRGKGRADEQSDYDFRVYADAYRGPQLQDTAQWRRFQQTMQHWQSKGFRMDGVWMRSYAGVHRDLARWIAGEPVEKSFEWTIWGYHLPTDLANQQIVFDPDGVLADWKRQLAHYPEPLRRNLLQRNRDVLSYWVQDYHYESKVERRDVVFLASLAARLAHAILQVVFAFNRVYFPGDGWNLPMAAELEHLPPDFVARMTWILQPDGAADAWHRQRAEFIAMVKDLEVLIAA